MKQELFDLYNTLKNTFIEEIEKHIEGLKKDFTPYIHISLPKDSDDLFEEITSIQYDTEENTWYVHNFITDTHLDVTEYWTPLRDFPFDELFHIAERL